ncbi:uncharacterized protein LOC136071394 [Quercus suber]|uniref:uncharacterized protein LOC136071394 n=1 Tax=Quercus suber TaxID=58331 RepID=UPI0032DFCE99
MADNVINILENMKLTTEEEEVIVVPDERRKDEIESCTQSLVGKFLTWDFNAILHSHKKQSIHPPPYRQMDDFRETLEQCQLLDLGFSGYPFTWNNRRPRTAKTRQRLDRAMATENWKAKFLIRTSRRASVRGQRRFKFEESWLLWEECKNVVHEAWNKMEATGSGLNNIKEKIASDMEEL